MAKREKLKPNPAKLAAEDFQRVVKDIRHAKENASEYVGMAGQATKNAIDRYGLDRKALSFAVGLAKAEETKRMETLRCVLLYADHLGYFSQGDMFSDLIDAMKDIIKRSDNGAPADAGEVDDTDLTDDDDKALDDDLTA